MSALSSSATPTCDGVDRGVGGRRQEEAERGSVLSFHSRAIYSSIRARTSGAGHESRPLLALLGFHLWLNVCVREYSGGHKSNVTILEKIVRVKGLKPFVQYFLLSVVPQKSLSI